MNSNGISDNNSVGMSSVMERTNFGCISKIESSWREFLLWIRTDNHIHPLAPVAPEYSEFVTINSKTRIRCIHINPDTMKRAKFKEFENEQAKSRRISLTEEYWFSKWNRPLQTMGHCNCSFRKSYRLSTVFSQGTDRNTDKTTSNILPLKITNMESFVERLIHDTVYEAIQEFYMISSLKNNKSGVLNLAFEGENMNVKKIHWEHQKNNVMITNFERCQHRKSRTKKPLVILLHGIGTSSDIWWIVIKSLVCKYYEVVAPDLLGHGYSSAPQTEKYYSFQYLVLHTLLIFDKYVGDDNRKCILIGHSYGCSLATAIYHRRMGLISQLILISGGGPTPLAPPVKNDELIQNECFQALIQPLIFCGVNRSLFYSSRGKFFDVHENHDDIGIPHNVLNFIRMGQSWPEGDAAFHRRIFVPTLLIHGLQDKHVTLVQECEMERTIPRSFLELIPNAGHMPMLETPEHLTHMILCFLDCWS